jgi:8-oxo-dGTP pyrophosphatase MutT (NUDIX family)
VPSCATPISAWTSCWSFCSQRRVSRHLRCLCLSSKIRAAREKAHANCIQYSVDDWCYEVPAGGLSPGLTPEEVVRRELSEEISGTAADLRFVGQFYTTNGISNEVAYVYLATGVELGEYHPEPTELMEIHLISVKEAMRMAREGQIADGPSALALLWCEPLLRS